LTRVRVFPVSLLPALRIGLLVGLVAALCSLTPPIAALEQEIGLGWLFRLRGARPPPAAAAVISMDTASIERLSLDADHERWPRQLQAELIRRLSRAGASLIVYDIFFERPRDAQSDRALAGAIADAGNVLLYSHLAKAERQVGDRVLVMETQHDPLPMFAQQAACTAPFVLPELPTMVNRIWTFKPGAGGVATLPVCAFQLHVFQQRPQLRAWADRLGKGMRAHAGIASSDASVRLADIIRALRETIAAAPAVAQELRSIAGDDDLLARAMTALYTGDHRRYINYYGPPQTLRTYSFEQVLRMSDDELAEFHDLGVFVGVSEDVQWTQRDTFHTPFSHRTTAHRISGVEICATVYANLVLNELLTPISGHLSFAIHLLAATLCGIIGRLFSPLTAMSSAAVLAVFYVSGALQLFGRFHVWLPLFSPIAMAAFPGLLAGMIANHLAAIRDQARLTETFARYLPRDAVAAMLRDLAGSPPSRELEGVCLLSDIQGYTDLSGRLSACALSELTREYFATVFKPIEDRGGRISQVVGDSVLALWIEPGTHRENCRRSCEAALAVQQAVAAFNAEHPGCEMPLRVGLHFGTFMMADLTAGSHHEYRAIGYMVNTASRLEAANKLLGTRMIVSDALAAQVDGLRFRDLGSFRLQGRQGPMRLFEPLGPTASATFEADRLVHEFADALDRFRRTDWTGAASAFAEISARDGDGPSRFYLAQCRALEVNPPPPDWDGSLYLAK
jgi:adenylate cyclase